MFFYEVEGHMPKLSSFGRGKTIRPKKSLTSFLHAALQLILDIKYTLSISILGTLGKTFLGIPLLPLADTDDCFYLR